MQNQLTQPVLILTYGYPGSGKTHFASRFAQEYGLVHISADRIRYELFDDPQHTPEENQVVLRLMDYMLSQALKSGSGVVYDTNNNRRSLRLKKRKIVEKYGAATLLVWVQTDIDTSFKRAHNRDRRHPEDKYSFVMPKEAFIRIKDSMTAPRYEEFTVISGKHDFQTQLKTLNIKLKKMGLVATVKRTESRFLRKDQKQSTRRPFVPRRRKINF